MYRRRHIYVYVAILHQICFVDMVTISSHADPMKRPICDRGTTFEPSGFIEEADLR